MTETGVKTVKLGTQMVKFPSAELLPLEDSNHLLGNKEALLKELDEKGYLYIKGLHDREEVLAARLAVLDYILNTGQGKLDLEKAWEAGVLDVRYICLRGFHNRNDVLEARLAVIKHMKTLEYKIFDERYPLEKGISDPNCSYIPPLQGKNNITHSDAVSKILEGPRPYAFFKTLFGEDARSFDYKWLRAVNRQEFTGAHVDNVYMCRGTANLLTMWTPFGDVDPEIGCLAVCEGSNRLPGFNRLHETYSVLDVESVNLNGTGWFTTDPFEITKKFGGQWKTTHFRAGDVLIFPMKTVHMSTANLTDLVRVSCDTRWQPASEPADPRYVGEFKRPEQLFGLYHNEGKKTTEVTIEELKEQWGLH